MMPLGIGNIHIGSDEGYRGVGYFKYKKHVLVMNANNSPANKNIKYGNIIFQVL